jgi:2C-methyl-D-erythritol 2,4-cyclodiphosphate synthase
LRQTITIKNKKIMKKTILFVASVAATVLAASCSKNTDTFVPQTGNTDAPQVCLTLGADGADGATRAFFDNTATAETWESEIKTLTVYAFDSAGKLIVKRSLSASEVAAKSASFALPNSAAGTNCSFYVVANADYGDVATTSAMDALMESATPGDYNGTFAEVATGRKRTAGFVMTGITTTKVATQGSSTTVSVALKRTVAKIAVRTKMDAAFSATYGNGTITINSVKVSKASSLSNSFYKTSYPSRSSLYEFTQTPQKSGSNFDGLVYLYENGTLTAGNRVMLTLAGYFDTDGNDSTTTDRSAVEYTMELTGAGNGEIKRNGYYRVDATIKGLSGDAVGVNISVAGWETPVTQTINLGN